MIKVMLIAWYIFVGVIWLSSAYVIFENVIFPEYPDRVYKKDVIESCIDTLVAASIALIIALLPNFIVAVIQWIVSLCH
ncbi:MAG: hypothetical protein SPG45_06345 [Lactobacillus johnsonii]|uniref:hypothetical protein n=1 Tax=Lactobacillus johnsonii TaxID=33959 RepID=UPI002A99DDDF|nr:hypothetical protein [Lactobacillus johnsonii]MDY5351671.1 hypothetical protein [Lactobacillus johnsonii]MDY5419651.1 hypothetical protein [Lactobacillus johnsonii]